MAARMEISQTIYFVSESEEEDSCVQSEDDDPVAIADFTEEKSTGKLHGNSYHRVSPNSQANRSVSSNSHSYRQSSKSQDSGHVPSQPCMQALSDSLTASKEPAIYRANEQESNFRSTNHIASDHMQASRNPSTSRYVSSNGTSLDSFNSHAYGHSNSQAYKQGASSSHANIQTTSKIHADGEISVNSQSEKPKLSDSHGDRQVSPNRQECGDPQVRIISVNSTQPVVSTEEVKGQSFREVPTFLHLRSEEDDPQVLAEFPAPPPAKSAGFLGALRKLRRSTGRWFRSRCRSSRSNPSPQSWYYQRPYP